MNRPLGRLTMAALIMVMSLGAGGTFASAPPPPASVSPHVLAVTEGGASASFLVVMREQADVSGAASLPTKADKGAFVYETLRQIALRSQAAIRAELDQAGIPYRAFYIVNMIEAEGDRDLVLKLAARPDVARIEANPPISNLQPVISHPQYQAPDLQSPAAVEWNIAKVNAPAAWAMGYTGQGVVVAGQDTGYQWDHPALKPHYRGWNGITATHDYNWHDAIHTTAGAPCPNNSPVPCDAYGHGTHTMGTMVGEDGAGNQVGMAPGAKWIGCRNMDNSGNGTPASYAECFEFFVAPYPLGGSAITQGVPSLAPAVVSNSWSCPPSEGCDALTLKTVVDHVRAAGIEVVAAAQNAGPNCSTIRDPLGIYESAFTVGATDSADAIAGFSSRGPVTADGSHRRKPDISAPGAGVRSTYPVNSWGYLSGTSMATPHVAGLFALIWSAAPGLRGNLAATENVITSTAVHLTTTQGCGADTPTSIPNNVYGWGRIDALAATQVVSASPSLRIALTAPAGPISATRLLTYALLVANPSQVAPNYNVTVTDQLPQDVMFANASSGGTYSPTTQRVTWLVPALAAQTSLTFTLAVTVGSVPGGTLIVNHAYAAQSDQVKDGVDGLPVTTLVYAVPQSGLQIIKTASANTIALGSLLTYTLIVSSPSSDTNHTGVVVTDTLPLDVTFVGASKGGVYSPTAQMVTWLAPTLTAQSRITLTLAVTVGAPGSSTLLPPGALIVNRDYGARSDQVTRTVTGLPVTTTVGIYVYYLPIVIASPTGSVSVP